MLFELCLFDHDFGTLCCLNSLFKLRCWNFSTRLIDHLTVAYGYSVWFYVGLMICDEVKRYCEMLPW